MTAPAVRTWALRALNVALEPLGLVVRTLDEQLAAQAEHDRITEGYFDAAQGARRGEARAQREADRWHREAERFHTAAKKAQRHLVELDALVEGRAGVLAIAARRVLDVALGRDTERAA
jgi:hypothetical protein